MESIIGGVGERLKEWKAEVRVCRRGLVAHATDFDGAVEMELDGLDGGVRRLKLGPRAVVAYCGRLWEGVLAPGERRYCVVVWERNGNDLARMLRMEEAVEGAVRDAGGEMRRTRRLEVKEERVIGFVVEVAMRK